MDTKLDNIDVAIIKSLMQDGRKSFRQIAREIKVSTPTVEARFSRLKGVGIIKNIQPIFAIDKIDSQMSLLFLSRQTCRNQLKSQTSLLQFHR